jgi:NAD-dependent SIR2 family protein deacetylase
LKLPKTKKAAILFLRLMWTDNLIEECHGSIHHFQCASPCGNEIWDAGKIEVEVDEEIFEAQEPLPRCKNCSGVARPNILMFGDWSWIERRSRIQSNRLSEWLLALQEKQYKLVIIEIGAGTAVATVRYFSEQTASRCDAALIRINPRDNYAPQGHISLPLDAAEGIGKIVEKI